MGRHGDDGYRQPAGSVIPLLRGLREQHDQIGARVGVHDAALDGGVEALVANRPGAGDHEEVGVASLRYGDAHLGDHVGRRHEVLDATVMAHPRFGAT